MSVARKRKPQQFTCAIGTKTAQHASVSAVRAAAAAGIVRALSLLTKTATPVKLLGRTSVVRTIAGGDLLQSLSVNAGRSRLTKMLLLAQRQMISPLKIRGKIAKVIVTARIEQLAKLSHVKKP